MKLEIIPEYNEVGKLFLSFENDFFNSRFKYGKTIAKITKAVNLYEKNVQIEIFVKPGDEDILACEFEKIGLDLFSSAKIILKYANSITSSVIPVFAKNQDKYYGITHNILRNKFGSDLENEELFMKWICEKEKISEFQMNFDFNGPAMIAMDDILLVSINSIRRNPGQEEIIKDFFRNFVSQKVIFIPSLPEEVTDDLDTYLFPIKNKHWITSKYPENSPQNKVIENVVEMLSAEGHSFNYVPGLERIIDKDMDYIPNYPNALMINNLILTPSFNRKEDSVIVDILQNLGFKVIPIFCGDIAQSNSMLHCISKTMPREILE